MDATFLKDILELVGKGSLSIDSAMERLIKLPFEDMGFAKVDFHRCIRQGVPEVIYCEGKTLEQITMIAQRLGERHTNVLATRATPAVYEAIKAVIPHSDYNAAGRVIIINPRAIERFGSVAVVTAGTSDIPVAEEAAVTAETLGSNVNRIYDVGVAGIHRLLHKFDELFKADVIVVAAGMEGALAGVVGGLVACPVIGVPTSVGYGASFGGVAALLSMLNSCASGLSVVNIDNGFGAGFQAHLINKTANRRAGLPEAHAQAREEASS